MGAFCLVDESETGFGVEGRLKKEGLWAKGADFRAINIEVECKCCKMTNIQRDKMRKLYF